AGAVAEPRRAGPVRRSRGLGHPEGSADARPGRPGHHRRVHGGGAAEPRVAALVARRAGGRSVLRMGRVMPAQSVWMDGELVPAEKAAVPFLSAGLHHGLGVFEGIRAYRTARGPAVFRLKEHARRLLGSAHVFALPGMRWSESEVVEAVREVVAANEFADCYIRPLVYVREGGFNLDLSGVKISLGIAAWEMGPSLGAEAREKGIRANVSSFTRHHPNVSMTKAKITGNYANSALAKTESVRLGFDEAIMLDPSGFVSECTGENLFIVRGRSIVTTATATILEGI